MNLLILNGRAYPRYNPSYRGTERAVPSYCKAYPEDHEINKLFIDWYLVEGGQSGVVHDLEKARRFMGLWNEHLGYQYFELIEVTQGQEPPVNKVTFLGFDISAGYCSSLLGAGAVDISASCVDVPEPEKTLCQLAISHFSPLLNNNLLFAKYDDAEFCLRVLKSIHNLDLSLSLYEGGDLSVFEVVGVHVLLGTERSLKRD